MKLEKWYAPKKRVTTVARIVSGALVERVAQGKRGAPVARGAPRVRVAAVGRVVSVGLVERVAQVRRVAPVQ